MINLKQLLLGLEAHAVAYLGVRICSICEQAITAAPLELNVSWGEKSNKILGETLGERPAVKLRQPIYQSKFLCLACLAGFESEPILVELDGSIQCVSVCPYAGTMREAICALKYQAKKELADDLAKILLPALDQLIDLNQQVTLQQHRSLNQLKEKRPNKNLLLVPVPLHRSKQKERGFNQSALIAQTLSVRSRIKCDTRALIRSRATAPQFGLSKQKRALNVSSAFSASPRVKGKDIVLIDDVLTSGATAIACATALKEAGANSTSVLTLARAILRADQHADQPSN